MSRFDLEEAHNNILKLFVEWLEKNWQGSAKKEWEKTFKEPYPEGHKEGWDACIKSLDDALDCYLEEI